MKSLRNTPRWIRLRPTLDRLEGRALMANAGGVDPTFGGGLGYYVGAINAGSAAIVPAPNPVSVAVESDSSIAVAFPEAVNDVNTYGVSHVNANGALDTAFGVGGTASLSLPGGINLFGGPSTLLVQADRKVILVGTGTVPGSAVPETLVARFNADGSVDSSFGTDGVLLLDNSAIAGVLDLDFPHAALQSDGKIVLAGSAGASPIAAIRLTSTGAIDTTYGTNGLATPAGTTLGELADGLVIQPGNQALILATKFDISTGQEVPSPALLRLNADGSLDSSLVQVGIAGSGLATPNDNGIIEVSTGLFAVLGRTASTSTTPSFPALAFFNADGSRLGSAPVFDPSTTLNGFAFDNHGRVVVTGFSSSTSSLSVFRLLINSSPDTTFGQGGLSLVPVPAPPGNGAPFATYGVAVDPATDNIVLAGANPYFLEHVGGSAPPPNFAVARVVSDATNIPSKTVAGDYTGDGKADPAVYLPLQGAFAIGDSSGQTAGKIVPFGTPGPGATIPVQGDFYGTGVDDIAAYIVQSGTFDVQDPTGQTSGISVQFGTPGPGQTIPAPGDYYGDGQDDVAVYLTGPGAFAIQDPTGQTSGMVVPFGMPGMNNSIPVPGDYDDSGRTELAVYVPSTATFYYRSAKTDADVAIPFGAPGLGVSLPMPGDYDGSGKTEVAVYIPALGAFYYRPADGGPDVMIPFGTPGAGKTLPAPGDYTGSGHTELGVYLTDPGTLAYQPAGGGNDVLLQFGSPGAGQSIPVTSTVLIPFPGTSVGGNAIGDSFGVPGPSDGLEALAFPSAGKKAKPGSQPTS